MSVRILVLVLVLSLPSGLEAMDLPYPETAGARTQGVSGSGPRLGSVVSPSDVAGKSAPTDTYVDLIADVFDPGKADPNVWMATATVAKVTFDGFNYDYGYDPLAQSYDLLVSGYAVPEGILVQETVGVMAAPLVAPLNANNVRRVEAWFLVSESNLFPNEAVGITDLAVTAAPRSSLDLAGMQQLYDDARGFSGAAYFLDALPVGGHAIDLGPQAAADLAARVEAEGWFGVGFAADGWDLSGSLGEMVYWKVAGGGGLPVANRPFFRVYYNAPPDPFSLTWPSNLGTIGTPQPTLRWQAATDPNQDTPITYTLRLGSDPSLASAFEMNVGAVTQTDLPFALSGGAYYWEVRATDPGGESRVSDRWSFSIQPTAVENVPDLSGPTLSAAPNPFNPRTRVEFTLATPQSVELWIADARGRRIRTLHRGRLDAGRHGLTWSGRDDAGRGCASGAYRAVLESASGRWTIGLSLLK